MAVEQQCHMLSLVYFLPIHHLAWMLGRLQGEMVQEGQLVEVTLLTCFLSYQIDLLEVKGLGLAHSGRIDYCTVNM